MEQSVATAGVFLTNADAIRIRESLARDSLGRPMVSSPGGVHCIPNSSKVFEEITNK